jgi:hypothetical protein
VVRDELRAAFRETRQGTLAIKDWRLELALSVVLVTVMLIVFPLDLFLTCMAGAFVGQLIRFAYFYAKVHHATPASHRVS